MKNLIAKYKDSPTIAMIASMCCMGLIYVVAFILSGCATLMTSSTAIDAMASNAGYVSYRAIPQARPVLSTICTLRHIADPEALQSSLKEVLGNAWTSASMINGQDAKIALLAINTLVGSIGLDSGTQASVEALKNVVAGLCKGVTLAREASPGKRKPK